MALSGASQTPLATAQPYSEEPGGTALPGRLRTSEVGTAIALVQPIFAQHPSLVDPSIAAGRPSPPFGPRARAYDAISFEGLRRPRCFFVSVGLPFESFLPSFLPVVTGRSARQGRRGWLLALRFLLVLTWGLSGGRASTSKLLGATMNSKGSATTAIVARARAATGVVASRFP